MKKNNVWLKNPHYWCRNAAGIGGMITVSNPAGCRAWFKDFDGTIRNNGCVERLRDKFFPNDESEILESNFAYWCNAACVHESLPMSSDIERTFVRLSMPSKSPWYKGYTKNPKGVEPTGLIIDSGFYRPGEPEVILKG